MPIRIITIPFDPNLRIFQEDELNNFIINKRVKSMKSRFFALDGNPFWTVFIDYEPLLEDTINEKELKLNDRQRLLFKRLVQWRKDAGDKRGIPAFIVASNKDLAEVARKEPATPEALRAIKGFGDKKTAKFGKEILNIVKAFNEKQKSKPEKERQVEIFEFFDQPDDKGGITREADKDKSKNEKKPGKEKSEPDDKEPF